MASRLIVLAHGRTRAAAGPVFGDPGPLAAGVELATLGGRVRRWVAGPEQACRETAVRLGGEPLIMAALSGPDPGSWRGRTVAEIAADDPAGLQAWLTDPAAAPHGGESLRQAQARLGRTIDHQEWPEGRSVVVVAPTAARLLALHAVGAPAELAFRLDVRPGGRFELSRDSLGWRLLVG